MTKKKKAPRVEPIKREEITDCQQGCMLSSILNVMAIGTLIIGTFLILMFLFSCTNVVMTHTEGTGASEALEDAQTTSPNVSPTLSIPFRG